MATDQRQRRAALKAFMDTHQLKPFPLSTAAGRSEGQLRGFLAARSRTMTDAAWEDLARGASKLLGRTVSAAEMRGEAGALVEIPVRSFVGAGDEVTPIDEDGPIDYTAAPPGLTDGEATEVRGRSMMPLYHHGDLLFHRRIVTDPARWKDEVVVAQVRNGKRFVKLLQPGSRRGRWRLVSVNPAFETLEDQQLDWVGPIEWVMKRRR